MKSTKLLNARHFDSAEAALDFEAPENINKKLNLAKS